MEDDNASSCSYRHAMRSCSTVRFSSPTRISSSSSSSSVSGSSSRNEDYDGVYENDGDQELVRLCQGSVESRGLLASEEAQESGRPGAADHLVVMVNGIVGSAKDWKFAADQIQAKLGDKIIVHCSSCNSALTTFNGIDFMGKRLADEVQEVIGRTSGLKKISFIAHSLGGLVARYAIARLYVPAKKQHIKSTSKKFQSPETKSVCLSAGLEPINFITLATPHLGSRGHEQLPFLFGLRCLEKLAISIAHWFVGRTGKHLFLADEDQGQLPLLQRMATDCEEGMFMSALRAFKRRVAYANVVNDHMVGWRTSSLRRESQLPKVKLSPVDAKYPHIMYVDKMQPLVNESKRSCQKTQVRELDNLSAQDPLEEELVTKLTEVPWERVDVTFHGANQRFIAHSTIQVKRLSMHAEGVDVISHLIDNLEVP
ncbi:hypothetical protein O6H91_07G037600 [Diphasiastrum complanatum]|uniref:Uncharacterized protein n=2 Tax=Diphasiastrum complanatum TaxID=34168 RepID=A0ACC2D452_DIPCM|nr:hypothetical protein O6H91_07G037600 [Diphasiastrum complanatum]